MPALTNFAESVARLEEAAALPRDDLTHRDSVILRFLLVYETAWKALRQCLAIEQIPVRYPKEAFRQAFQVGWLENETIWLKMLEDRNLVAHTYDEATALRIRDDVDLYLPELERLREFLTARFGDQVPS